MPLYGLFNVLIYTTATWRPKLIKGISNLKTKITKVSFHCYNCDKVWGNHDEQQKDNTDIEMSNSIPHNEQSNDTIGNKDDVETPKDKSKQRKQSVVTFSSSAFKKGSRELVLIESSKEESSKSTNTISETEVSSSHAEGLDLDFLEEDDNDNCHNDDSVLDLVMGIRDLESQ